MVKHHTIVLSDNLNKKEKHMVEKLEAQIEYEEAHDHPDTAEKYRERIERINEKASSRHKAEHDDPIKVVHNGGHKRITM